MARMSRKRATAPRKFRQPATRSRATRTLASGVGASVPRPFGSSRGASLACWDAKHPSHLALPRAVGPYTTIRATRRVSVNNHANVIGTFQNVDGQWQETVLISDVTSTNDINAPANAITTTLNLDGMGAAATLVPSALTVQVMCPTALQIANGIVYAGVMNSQAAIDGRPETWNDYMEKFVQFQSPRLLAASKLALRGVQISSYPLNMSEISRFTPLAKEGDGVINWSNYGAPTGWAPIVIYNPSGAQLELLITVEYRVRFDLSSPASASHTHHPVASDGTWDALCRQAAALGNGVADIADVVANTGMAVGRALAVGNRLAGAARALPIA